jgi:hypothetical protein
LNSASEAGSPLSGVAADDALLVWLAARPSIGKQATRHSPSTLSASLSLIGDRLLAGAGSLDINEWDRAFESLMLEFQKIMNV